MNYIDYHKPDTKAGEIMDDYTPLQKIDYAVVRKADRKPEKQPGSGVIGWLAVAAICWLVIFALAGSAGYFN